MHFRFYPVFLLGLCLFSPHSHAVEPMLPASAVSAASSVSPAASSTPDRTIYIDAQEIKGMKDDGTEAHGKVELKQGNQKVFADHVFYKQKTGDLSAYGSVRVEQPGGTIKGPDLKMNSYTSVSEMSMPEFQVSQNKSRGSASMMRSSDKLHYEYDNAKYTTCPAGDDDWFLHMSSLNIDKEAQIGSGYNVWIDFMSVPFIYVPWIEFTLEGRHSGLLAPTYGYTATSGQEYSIPFYWNIAPNYDATITPRVMNQRGTELQNEFRFLGKKYSGEIHYDDLNNDHITATNRTHGSLGFTQDLGGGFSDTLQINRVSDIAYFQDLGITAAQITQTQLLNVGSLSYNAGWGGASISAQEYQTLGGAAVPYARLPQIKFNSQNTINSGNGEQTYYNNPAVLNVTGEYVDFVHPTRVNGERFLLYPSITYSLLEDSGYYLKPKLGIHDTQYFLSSYNTSNIPDEIRTIPIFTLDGGMTFERDAEVGDASYTQTLEPRVFYVNIPYLDQTRYPVFDTTQTALTSFTQLFQENRFTGSDRVGDANMLTAALTSRLIENEGGRESLRIAIGKRFSYQDPLVNLVDPNAIGSSNILFSLTVKPNKKMTFDSLFNYNPTIGDLMSYNTSARYSPETGKVLNLGYRYSRVDGTAAHDLRQSDISTQWPLFWHWDMLARWTYAWTEPQQVVEQMVGFEYNASCWALRLVRQKFPIPGQPPSTSTFIQLELKDLVGIGKDPLSTLRTEIPGYSKLNDIKN